MTFYELLGVAPSASVQDIRSAYEAKMKQYRDDAARSGGDCESAVTKELDEAYKVLTTPQLRSQYDKMLLDKHASGRRERNLWPGVAVFLLAALLAVIFYNVHEGRPEPPVETSPTLSAVAEPVSGEILLGGGVSGSSSITVTAGEDSSCLVKLKNVVGETKLCFYVRAGDTVTVPVPGESFYVHFASGDIWYGVDHLFGSETVHSFDGELCEFGTHTYAFSLSSLVTNHA